MSAGVRITVMRNDASDQVGEAEERVAQQIAALFRTAGWTVEREDSTNAIDIIVE